MEKRKYQLNIYKIFLMMLINSFIFAYVIERVFAIERGLSIMEMQYIGVMFAAVSIVLEVPSGVLADKWKKKYVWALGMFFCFFEFFISIFAYDFRTFCGAFFMAAIGCSLKSGTYDSLLYESLAKLDRHEEYEKLKGYMKLLKYFGHGVVGIIGGYIAERYGLVTNYWLSLIGTPISILICLSLHEPDKIHTEHEHLDVFLHIKEAVCVVKENKIMIGMILYAGVIGAVLYGQLHEMSSIAYPKLMIPLYMFGYIGLAITLFGGLGGVVSARLKVMAGYRSIFGGILVMSVAALYMFSKARAAWEVIYLVIAVFTMETVEPLVSGYVHNNIADKYRATISSIQAFVLNVLTILVGLLFGYFADKYGIFYGFRSMVVLLLIFGGVISLVKLKNIKWYKTTERM